MPDQRPERPPKPKEEPYRVSIFKLGNRLLTERSLERLQVGTVEVVKPADGDEARLQLYGDKQVAKNLTPSAATRPKQKGKHSGSRARARARVMDDELGKLITQHTADFMDKNWRTFIKDIQGRGNLDPSPSVVEKHPAGPLVKHLATNGVPVIMQTEPWSDAKIKATVARGPHKSCDEHLDFLRGEMLDFVRKGYWVVLPLRLWKQKAAEDGGPLRKLRLALPGVIPQQARRPRWIIDYTQYLQNNETFKMGPAEVMQFARALERTLWQIYRANPRYGPVRLGTVDIDNGFYRVMLQADGVPQLGALFPKYPGEEQMIGIPTVLPMGWVESVPYFCAVTETVVDLANNMPANIVLPEHPLEAIALTKPTPTDLPAEPVQPAVVQHTQMPLGTDVDDRVHVLQYGEQDELSSPASSSDVVLQPFQKPVRLNDVYVDDMIYGAQGLEPARQQLRRLLHAVDEVFRPVDDRDSEYRQPAASVKKLRKGDAYPGTIKKLLGWILDTLLQTLELPPHRKVRLLAIFDDLHGKDRVSLSQWRKVLGELRSMAIGIPGCRGLFSCLQHELKFAEKNRIHITPEMRDLLSDFEELAKSLAERPTHFSELVPDYPVAIGLHDASGQGMGGVWLPAVTNTPLQPILWRARFPETVTSELVSFGNPTGTITNLDLELAGGIGEEDVLLQEVDCTGRTTLQLGDNTPSIVWHNKGSTSTTGPAAYLLRMKSLHQRHFRYLSKAGWISGPANQMADDCSRLWHLSDSQLLAYFNSQYPQRQSWKLVHLRPQMLSALTNALLKRRPLPALFLNEPQ